MKRLSYYTYKIKFQFLIGSLIINKSKEQAEKIYKFQFLIGSLIILELQQNVLYQMVVSIPYRQSNNEALKNTTLSDVQVSIPYRQSNNMYCYIYHSFEYMFQFLIGSLIIGNYQQPIGAMQGVSIPYRQSNNQVQNIQLEKKSQFQFLIGSLIIRWKN